MRAKLLQSCPTLCDPMDCSLPSSSVHGNLQARVLEWVAISASRGSSLLRDGTLPLVSPALAVRFFTTSAIWEAHGISDAMDMNLGKLQEIVRDREAWRASTHGVNKESDTAGWLNNSNVSLVSIPTPPSILLFVRAFQLISKQIRICPRFYFSSPSSLPLWCGSLVFLDGEQRR